MLLRMPGDGEEGALSRRGEGATPAARFANRAR